jgi:hypothetical protein
VSRPDSETPDQGNVVESEVLAERRAARRAELGPEAALELQLFEAERRVSEVEAERDALRARLGKPAATPPGDTSPPVARALAAAEAEVTALTAERARLRKALGEERPSADGAGLAIAVSAIQEALSAVGFVRDGMSTAVRLLREELAAERAGREAAEATVARLRLERTAEDGSLAARVQGLRCTAIALQEGLAEQATLRSALHAMEVRLGELQAGLREELERERAARWVAEQELDAERAAHAVTRAELSTLREGAPRAVDPDTLASLRATFDQLRTAPAPATPDPGVSFDLAAAAQRLRASAAAEGERPEAASLAPAAPGAPAMVPSMPAPPEAPVVAKVPTVAPSVPAAPQAPVMASPEPAPAPVALPVPLLAGIPGIPPRPPLARRTVPLPSREASPGDPGWLNTALTAFADQAPEDAERLFAALLPAQAGLVRKPVAYDLVISGGGALRVALDHDRAEVAERPAGALPADARFAGRLRALVPLVAGGAARRLPGVEVDGRRKVRRLLRARRAPLTLAKLARAGVSPDPRHLLALLVAGVDPAWTVGRAAVVDIDALGAQCLRVRVPAGGRPTVTLAEGGAESQATLRVPAGALLAVLADTAPTGTGLVEGDLPTVLYLLDLFDRARRAA